MTQLGPPVQPRLEHDSERCSLVSGVARLA